VSRARLSVLGLAAAGLAIAPSAGAVCTYGGCPDQWPSDCYNLKSTEWCPQGGVSTVTLTNHGSYESAFDWARAELSDPHNGIANSLTMTQVASGGQIDVYDYTGSADWWGLADQYVTSNGTCLTSARIQVNKGYMTSTVRKEYTLLHEMGHAVGLNHVCVCPRTMNPCGTCGDDAGNDTPYLKTCDAKGIAAKYPPSEVAPDDAAEEILDQAHLLDGTAHSDVDGDGIADVCARGSAGVRCYLSAGTSFGPAVDGPALSDDTGWSDGDNATTLRLLDMDGDGRADLCARANAGIRCWKSTGQGFSSSVVGPELSDDASWDDPMYFTTLRAADFDGDGKDDLCARAGKGWLCWSSTGNGFGPAVVGPALSNEAGWSKIDRYATIQMGDVDGDGKADVCSRDGAGMRCWISDGKGFPNEIAGPDWSDASGWNAPMYFGTIRLADVDGDGKADLCARGATGYRCHLSTGDGFGPAMTGPAWSTDAGWGDYDNYSTIRLGDVDGDGDLDVCGRANKDIVCARWEGSGFGPTFDGPPLGDAAGWNDPARFRTLRLADVNGDGKADLCGREAAGFDCWLSDGDGFPTFVAGPAWSDAKGWTDPVYYASIRLAGVAPKAASGGAGGESTAATGSAGSAVGGDGGAGLGRDPEPHDGELVGRCDCTVPRRTDRAAPMLLVVALGALARARRRAASRRRWVQAGRRQQTC